MTRPTDSLKFDSLGLADSLISAVTALGYEEPTPIQREAIPILLSGRDVFGQAGTGTGKTAAFALPLLHRLVTATAPAKGATRALILVPTRELAMQVAEAIHKYARKTSITVVPVYGGAPMHQQIRALSRGADVVVATPGRALDHLRRQTLSLDKLEVLVLDEADEMLDMGFAEDLETILKATPPGRQTALFAATMAPRIGAIAERHMRKPARIEIKGEKRPTGAVPRVRQSAYVVTRPQKGAALGRILEFEDPASAIVFCRTRVEVDELTETLLSHGYGAQALHGGMEQKQRDRVMNAFRQGKADVLVATDVAARGLDIEHVSHVINFDIPTAPEVYVHRIGRTGRAGREGVALTLVDPREQRFLRHIENLTRQQISILPLPTEEALRAKRIDSLRASLAARITKGGLEGPRGFVTELAHDVDLVDIAAAAVALLAESETKDAGGSDAAPTRSDDGLGDAESRLEAGVAPMTTLFFSAGRSAGIRPGDLVGAIAGEAQLTAKQIGAIKIGPHHSLVEVPEALAERVMTAMRRTKLRGQKVDVKLARDVREDQDTRPAGPTRLRERR